MHEGSALRTVRRSGERRHPRHPQPGGHPRSRPGRRGRGGGQLPGPALHRQQLPGARPAPVHARQRVRRPGGGRGRRGDRGLARRPGLRLDVHRRDGRAGAGAGPGGRAGPAGHVADRGGRVPGDVPDRLPFAGHGGRAAAGAVGGGPRGRRRRRHGDGRRRGPARRPGDRRRVLPGAAQGLRRARRRGGHRLRQRGSQAADQGDHRRRRRPGGRPGRRPLGRARAAGDPVGRAVRVGGLRRGRDPPHPAQHRPAQEHHRPRPRAADLDRAAAAGDRARPAGADRPGGRRSAARRVGSARSGRRRHRVAAGRGPAPDRQSRDSRGPTG